jgi:hypothetical protein
MGIENELDAIDSMLVPVTMRGRVWRRTVSGFLDHDNLIMSMRQR